MQVWRPAACNSGPTRSRAGGCKNLTSDTRMACWCVWARAASLPRPPTAGCSWTRGGYRSRTPAASSAPGWRHGKLASMDVDHAPELVGDGVRLRPLRDGDIARRAALGHSREIARGFGEDLETDEPMTEPDAAEELSRQVRTRSSLSDRRP